MRSITLATSFLLVAPAAINAFSYKLGDRVGGGQTLLRVASVDTVQPEEKTAPSIPEPGAEENAIFQCDENVDFWRNFQRGGLESTEQNVRAMAAVASSFTEKGPDAVSYWVRHVGRSAYFAGNAVLGNIGFDLHERLVNGDKDSAAEFSILPINMQGATASRLALEALLCYQQDYKEIKSGTYVEPWDMQLNHRQSSPINFLTQTGRFVEEAIGTLARRKRGQKEDKEIWISNDAAPGLYPDYYRNAFHFQTDGWMSKKSANVYETSTETLFLGRQDAMQRTSLKPLVELSNKLKAEGRPMRILEVACGTGRFMTFVRDSLPLDTEYTAVDLSPYYLDAARENDKYWRSTRKRSEQRIGISTEISPAKIVQAQAENLPFESESFDAVLCVYLFHELPRDVRAKAASEMARIVAPGGTVVLTDSIQRGDRPILDPAIGNFGDFNEPYYVDYTQDFLASHFEKSGLKPGMKSLRSTTKSLSFTK
jgi:ubiquinone/menaquinone biosynthesis C-methylase UbiE